MGALAHFDLPALIAKYGVLHFVETGTGKGEGLAHAVRFRFSTLRSCDILSVLADSVAVIFRSDHRVMVQAQESASFLHDVCVLIPEDEPILFWLDAHFPGADYGMHDYGYATDDARRLPLLTELAMIIENRPAGKDVVLVDDLRIWVDGAFGSGNLPATVRPFCPRQRDASFFGRVFGATHDVRFDYAQEGYVVLTPKEAEDRYGKMNK